MGGRGVGRRQAVTLLKSTCADYNAVIYNTKPHEQEVCVVNCIILGLHIEIPSIISTLKSKSHSAKGRFLCDLTKIREAFLQGYQSRKTGPGLEVTSHTTFNAE